MLSYPGSVRFLYALGNELKTAKFGLERIRAVLKALGDPHNAFRSVHVAGTNGKGSTCAMIDAGLRAAHIRTGLFTSPHLIEPTERIQIDGMAVSAEQFQRAFNVVHEAAESLDLDCHPTYFETVTAMAFWLFREMRVEIGVIEVGLGGRLDATNVIEPVVTIITPIDFDHEAYLGSTIESIAGEKAGILKRGVPAVFAKQRPEAAAVLNARASELGIEVTRADDFEIRDLHIDSRGSHFSLASGLWPLAPFIEVPLAGEHQIGNAIVAALALHQLGFSQEGIRETRWPGRMELVAPNPDVILDGAHNPAGARALAAHLARFYSHRKIWMIYGAMRDKAIEEIAGILFPVATELIFTAPHAPRALRPEALVEIAGRGETAETIAEALENARTRANADDVIVITGSLFLVGEARALFASVRQSYPSH